MRQKLGEIQDINILPDLRDSDIPRTTNPINFTQAEIMGIPFYFTDQPTNGITYFRMKFDLRDIPDQYRQYLKLFCQIFPRLGTKSTKAGEFMQLFDLYTYNFELQHLSFSSPTNLDQYEEYIQLSIACLDNNIEHMFNYLTEILAYPDFSDYTNISQLIKIYSSEAANNLVEDSLSYALSYAAGGFSIGSERTEKLQSTRFICDLGASFLKTTNVKDILINLERNLSEIFNNIFKQKNIIFCVHGNKDIYAQVNRRIELLCHTIKGEREIFSQAKQSKQTSKEVLSQEKLYKTYFPLPMQTNYVVEAFPIPHFTHPDTPKLHILAEILSLNILEEEIKEKGGAFSGGVHINPNGVLSFYSYRDPHFLQTYQSFEKGVQWASNGEFNLQQIKEAKLQALLKLEQSESPLDKGLKLLFNGVSNELRDEYRQRILDTTKEELVSVTNKYLLEKIKEGKTSQIIFGSQSNNLEGLLSRGWKIERPVEGLSVNEGSYEQNKSSTPRLTYDL